MNDATLHELKITVERAVRPVVALTQRKRQMREELLAHLTSVFEEEFHKSGNGATALQKTRDRFGEPTSLTAELHRTVSAWDRARVPLQNASVWNHRESALRYCTRLTLATAAVSLVAFVLLAVFLPSPGAPFMVWRMVVAEPVFMTVFGFSLLYFPIRIGPALYGPAGQRSMRRAMALILASVPILPLAMVLFVGILSGDPGITWQQSLPACYFAPVAPVLLTLLARVMWREYSYEHEWARLEIDD